MSDPVRDRLGTLDAHPGPSAEARARMLAGADRSVRARRRARVAAVSVSAVAALVLTAYLVGGSGLIGSATPSSSSPVASSTTPSPTSEPSAVHHLAPAETLALATATLVARDEATLSLGDDETILLAQGTIGVDGTARVEGGDCRASVDGRCEVTRFEHSVRFIVEAGEVRPRSAVATCTIVDLEEPATPEAEEDTEPAPAPEQAHAPRPRPVDPTELAQQTEAYRQALALLGHDDTAALAALRAMQTRWPRGSLAPEVDFQIVRVLVRTGTDDDVRAAARTFLRRHPRSARAPEMQRLLDSEEER